METHELIIKGLQALIEVGIAVLVPIVIKYVLTKISRDNLIRYITLAEMVVKTVQQTMGDADNEDKKSTAVDKLSKLTHGSLNSQEIEHLLEAAVFEVKKLYKAEIIK